MRKFKFMSFVATLAAALVVSGCTPPSGSDSSSGGGSSQPPSSQPQEQVSQGVTATKIKVGNAATVTGAYAAVGVPFNAGLKARLWEANKTPIDGRTIEFVTYDDGGLAAQGAQRTERLVEDDKVFSIVGHFGTWTVGQTLNYLRDVGIPMVYAASGINQLYFKESPKNNIFAVQPIYQTEGQIYVARLMKETDVFGTINKFGVIYTKEDAGLSMLVGVEQQIAEMNIAAEKVVKQAVDPGADYSAAVIALKNAGVDAVIVATNQSYFKAIVEAMAANALIKPVVTSYVSAAPIYIPAAAVDAGIEVYTNAWVDILSQTGVPQAASFTQVITDAIAANALNDSEVMFALHPDLVAFTIAGYVAGDVFVTGLERVAEAGKVLNWKNYIDALESAPVEFPMGGPIDFTGGKRHGLDKLALLKAEYVAATAETAATVILNMEKPLEELAEIMAK